MVHTPSRLHHDREQPRRANQAPIVALLNAEIVKALHSPAVREAVENSGGETVGNTAQEFAAVIAFDAQKYAKLVKISGAKAD
ncbi:MAG: hypothetical protein V7640_2442 [Betaproteobacteria bacterium]